jgi:hypothetical protein
MKNPKGGRPKAEIEREVVKAYPLPEDKELLEQYAKESGMSLSSYLIQKGLKNEIPIMRMSCCDRMQAWGNGAGIPKIGEDAFCVHCQKTSKITKVF